MFTRALFLISAAFGLPAGAQQLTPAFAPYYTVTDLGRAPGLLGSGGGLSFLNENTLLISDYTSQMFGSIHSIGVTRDPVTQHITGFDGSATLYANAPYLENLTVGPGGILFYTLYNLGEGDGSGGVGQIKPGNTDFDKLTSYPSMGIVGSDADPSTRHQGGGLQFVPDGFPGAGQLKISSYYPGVWHTVPYTSDGNGTYNLGPATGSIELGIRSEGFVYISGQNPGFEADSVLVSSYGHGTILAFEIDSNGDPILSTRRDFLTLSDAMGATRDPVTGDMLFSSYGSQNRIVVVSSMVVPEPGTAALTLTTLVAWGIRRRR